MTPEAELLQALRSGDAAITRHSAWLELFLQLAQPRLDALGLALQGWADQADAPLPFAALTGAEELAGLCAEQGSDSLAQLAQAICAGLRQASAAPATPAQRLALAQAGEELLRQLHQHAAGVTVVTPPGILAALRTPS
jgi:hypothetical protein